MEYRTYKRKLILNKREEQRLRSWIGVSRLVYNMSLEIRQQARIAGKRVSKYDLMLQLKYIRADYDWVRDVPVQVKEAAIKRLDAAFETFFKTCHMGGGYPRFANKRKFKSIQFKTARIVDNKVKLPRIGFLRMMKDAPIIGTPVAISVKIEPTGFFIFFRCENAPRKFNSENQAIGLDMGITHFCVDSLGGFTANPKHVNKYERLLRIEQRALSRKKKGSHNWQEQANRVSRLLHKIKCVRMDFLHKESTKIAKANSLVFVEDLRVADMAKNKNLSKHILDCGWGMFRQMLEYKTTVVRVDPKHTSQTCNLCNHTAKENRVNQSEFVCQSCGHTDNADLNAAKNILSRGTAVVRQREAIVCALGE